MTRALGALVAALMLAAPAADDGWRDLFNGKDLDGWVAEGATTFKDGDAVKPVWVVEDGLLRDVVPGRSYGFLRYTRQEFGDFALRLEYRFEKKADPKAERGNSGVGIRTPPYDPKKPDSRPSAAAYEVQILDDADRKPDKHSNASLYGHVAPSQSAARPAPEWNTLEIECVGPRIKVTVNGARVIDFDQTTLPATKDKPLKGYINLQNHGSKIDFRNIRIREIKG
jgi:hypothetical protein